MSATNSTTHYSLPSFLGSDKPAWLVDWNGAMSAIDSAIYEAKSTADSAVTAAAAVASDLATLSGTVSTQGSSITTLSETLTTAVGNINTINGNINTINSLIGNGTPTTTDQTLIGAINEINANVTDTSTLGTLAYTVANMGDDLNTWTDITSQCTINSTYDDGTKVYDNGYEYHIAVKSTGVGNSATVLITLPESAKMLTMSTVVGNAGDSIPNTSYLATVGIAKDSKEVSTRSSNTSAHYSVSLRVPHN